MIADKRLVIKCLLSVFEKRINMAFDEGLAERIREVLEGEIGLSEKKMFGGLCFMLHGHMCAGIVKEELMIRVGPDGHDTALAEPHARLMDFTGKPMRGMVYVEAEGFAEDSDLEAWLDRGREFVRTLPPKKK
jgi:TfoX/Sxy family transcriptional regulator of competence genes